ncbi:MAG TPA: NnrS family protein [Nitrospira sp.]|nr:NnrS family protein [Nitrospira sp.]
MPDKPIDITVSQPQRTEAESNDEPVFPKYGGPPFLSYGFRPFFLGAAVFAGVAVPVWVLTIAGLSGSSFLYTPREWHIHEMLFGFLPAVMTGFLLTAIPNWTGRAPLRGVPLMLLWVLWLAGRLLIAMPWPSPLLAAIVDGAFLVVLAVLVWREIAAGGSWTQMPIAGMISLYAAANMVFHALASRGAPTDFPEHVALALIMLLLTTIGGRVTPNFTREFLARNRMAERVASFSRLDGLSIVLVLASAVTWIVQPESVAAGGMWVVTGLVNLIRLSRWRGWMAWREPLVWILHVGYGWLVLSFLALGTAMLSIGLPMPNAVHVLTTGAVGTMTLAVMTRASLGHTGRPRHAGSMTVLIYVLANVGGMLRVFTPTPDVPTTLTNLFLSVAALSWSGAYVLYAAIYGPFLVRPSLDE